MRQTSARHTISRPYYEFFAGGGMARAGLGERWNCIFANDFDSKKARAYAANWGNENLSVCDVARLAADDVPGHAVLAWASFPCQDLSLAGAGAGLKGERSGTFWPFWDLIRQLERQGRPPKIVALENVAGALASHSGKDFVAIAEALAGAGYVFGAVLIDAIHFVPQSRQRLFVIGVHEAVPIPSSVIGDNPESTWHGRQLLAAAAKLSKRAASSWRWWKLPTPPKRNVALVDVLEESPNGVPWHTLDETRRLISMMSAVNKEKLRAAQRENRRVAGTVYKRTRIDADGRKIQRAEVRFDNVAGCLRTPAGGSSRQTIMIVNGRSVRSRLLSSREAARLMGLPDAYQLPENYNEAYHLAGDGVVVPVVRFLAENLLEPIAASSARRRQAA